MNCEQAKTRMADSWVDRCEDPELTLHLAECEECSVEMAALSPMWNRMGDFPIPEPSRAMGMRFESALNVLVAENPVRGWHWSAIWPRNPAWQAAVAAACLVAGLTVGAMWPHGDGGIAKLREEVATTRELVALSMLRQQSAAGRLQGVEYTGRMKTMEPDVIEALVQAVERDSSVNVRLAAIDALGSVVRNDGVRRTLTRSLGTQESPMVQAALIDYFVDAHDRGALGAIRNLEQNADVNPTVRERSRVAMRELSQ